MAKRKNRRRKMRGGNAFTDFLTKTIPSGFKKIGNYVVNNPLSSLSHATGAFGLIPGPFAPVFRGISTVSGLTGKITGKGRKGVRMSGRGVV